MHLLSSAELTFQFIFKENYQSVKRAANGLEPEIAANGVASYTHQRETTGSSSGSLQLRPFLNWELLLKERIFSQRERILSFKGSSLWY